MFIVLDKSNTATVSLNNPRNGHQEQVCVYAHPRDIGFAVMVFAQRQRIHPATVETSIMWPADQHALSARTIAETASAL